MRLQLVHSTVPSKLNCGLMRWRTPSETMSGSLTVVSAPKFPRNGKLNVPLIF